MKSDTIRQITPNIYNLNCENWLYDFVTDFQTRIINYISDTINCYIKFYHKTDLNLDILNNICGQSIIKQYGQNADHSRESHSSETKHLSLLQKLQIYFIDVKTLE